VRKQTGVVQAASPLIVDRNLGGIEMIGEPDQGNNRVGPLRLVLKPLQNAGDVGRAEAFGNVLESRFATDDQQGSGQDRGDSAGIELMPPLCHRS
jgi:hypothetical protein